jgi:imidazolonepropionase-like amidohydrolase
VRRAALLLAGATSLLAAPLTAQDFAVTGATVVIGDGSEPIPNGTVVVRDGKIVAAGANVAVPAGLETIDGRGRWVTPGLFSALTDLGLWDVEEVDESNDTEADDSPFGAALDVTPAINPLSQHVAVSRAGGVTRASVAGVPGGTIFAGQGALIDLGADMDAVMLPRAFQVVTLAEHGGAIAGGSRVAAHALFRNALREAKSFDERGALAAGTPPIDRGPVDLRPIDPRLTGSQAERGSDVLLTRFDAAALIPVVRGEQPLYVEVYRASDILAVLALREEFPRLRLVLVGATEGWLVAREIAAAGVPVITEPLTDLPARFEELAATQSNVGRMVQAGVKVAIGGFAASNQPRYAPQQAGNLVALGRLPGATGLTWGEAFAAISSVPAEIAGLGGTLGVLKDGAHGDVVLWDGDPLEVSSAPLRVFIDGVEQPLDNHQTRLRERYRTPGEGDLPKAYER